MRIVRSKTMSKEMQLFTDELSALLAKHRASAYVDSDRYGFANMIFRIGPEEVAVYGDIDGSDGDFETISVEVEQQRAKS